MKRNQKMGLLGLCLVSGFFVSPVFQNCAKTNFQATDPTPSGGGETPTSVRSLAIDPSFNQEKADMKVLFVVDDSYTMSQSQAQLANAIDSLLNPLQGHNVEFKIVSTSGVPGNEIDYTIKNKYFSTDGIEIPESQTSSLNSYLIERNVTNATTNRHGLLKLYKDSTYNQFVALKSQVKSAILAVGVNGSDIEEGLCATARQIYDETTSRFFKPGDKAAIVLLTDEDDTSVFNRCSSRYRQRVSAKPVVYYNYGQQRAKLSLEYQLTRDGVTSWQAVVWGVSLKGARTITIGTNCSSSDQTDAIAKITSQGFVVRNVASCVYDVVPASYYGADLGDDGSDPNKNLCASSLYFNGAPYANLYAMVDSIGLSAAANSCTKQIIPSNQLSEQTEYDSVVRSDGAALSAQDLKLAILNKSNSLFGSSGYIYASLVHISGESCALKSGQSYGVKYQDLSSMLGQNHAVIQSLCNTDFSNTLSQVSQFIVTEAENSFSVTLSSGEKITGVSVKHNGQTVDLTSSQYEAVGGSIRLLNYNLVQGDVLIVQITSQ